MHGDTKQRQEGDRGTKEVRGQLITEWDKKDTHIVERKK